jgi:hypothetical protein
MPEILTGGCSCGAIRYECTGKPIVSFNCHCRECQHFTGSGYIASTLFPISTFKITQGAVKEYRTVGENGSEAYRGFCHNCGSPVATRLARMPQVIGIPAGSMDNPSIHKPTTDFFVRDAQPWDIMDPKLMKFDTQPPPRIN